MKPAFAGNPGASAVYFLTLAVWAVIEVRQALNRRAEATNMDRGSFTVVRLASVAGVILAALAIRVTATAFPYNGVIFGISLAVI